MTVLTVSLKIVTAASGIYDVMFASLDWVKGPRFARGGYDFLSLVKIIFTLILVDLVSFFFYPNFTNSHSIITISIF